MFCTKCGLPVADTSSFCPECGQDLRTPETLNVQAAPAEPMSPSIDQSSAVSSDETIIQAAAAPAAAEVLSEVPAPTEVPAPIPAAVPTSSAPSAVTAAPAPQADQQAYTAPQSTAGAAAPAPAAQKATSETGSKIGAFFKEYFKSPVTAVSSRSTNEYWLWGLISISAYLLINFFVSLIGIGSIREFGYQFGYFIGDIVRFATLIFAYFLFQSVFKLKKKSLTAIISAVGLAFLPILPVYLIGLAIDRIFQYSSILQGLLIAVYVVAGIILFSELKESSKDVSGARSLLVIAISIACMPIISGIIDAIVYRLMYLPYIYPYY